MPLDDIKWEVRGANRATGEDDRIEVTAPDEAHATKEAGRRGLLIESVKPIHNPLSGNQEKIPDYDGIIVGSRTLKILAAFCGIPAVLIVIAAIIHLFASPKWLDDISNESSLSLFATSMITASVLFMTASIADAVRDIARNSFRK